MHAIIEDSGTQIRVATGDVIDVDLRTLAEGEKTITFDRVLMLGGKGSNEPSTIGTPFVGGATVTAEILDEVKGQKIDVVKFKRRKGSHVKQGHRQRYLRVRIGEINGG